MATALTAVPAAHEVEIVVPVYNEELALSRSVRRLHDYLEASFPFSWRILIVDNASTDGTLAVAERLSASCRTSMRCTCAPRGGGGPCARPGSAAPRRLSVTWTLTCRPICARCSRSWRR